MRTATILNLGAQTATERFGARRRGSEHEEPHRPPIATWRCNLTALSQRWNLLFVASAGQIWVYEPKYPTQALPSKPALVIDTTPSRLGLTGTLDPRNPRAINYLVIQPFGLEEIIAVARDDGDVEAFLVRQVVHAVESKAAGEVADVRPFWQQNVGLSAWGLAIHSAARIIAVSSNTHNVTIFKFGLIAADFDDHLGMSTRELDVAHAMVNGTTNIPYISFCNTGDDPEGRWLLTTDIVGTSRAIDIANLHVAYTLSFVPVYRQALLPHERFHAGWGLIFLDRRSFVREDNFATALGLGNSSELPSWDDQIWDISGTIPYSAKFSIPERPKLSSEARSDADTDTDPEDSDSGESSSSEYYFHETGSIPEHPPCRQDANTAFCDALPCPILHASVKNAYLLQPGGPILGFTNACRQRVQTELAGINYFERLNMNAYIPAIGVVILASQKGRALIISLTKLERSTELPPELPNQRLGSKTIYTMRIDHILPFQYQEDQMQRPFQPLLGIAVGPIQGAENRWRLLMTYYDHTVLSYEIGRSGASNASAKIENVVV